MSSSVANREGRSSLARVVGLLAVLALVLSGCAAQEVTEEPPRSLDSGEEQPVSQIGQGGTAGIVLPKSTAPGCLNPYLAACDGAQYLSGIVFEGLLGYGSGSEVRPVLATSVPSYGADTLSLEPMSVEVEIRRGATFSDGEPVTAEDVAWTYEEVGEAARSGAIMAEYVGFKRVEAVEVTGERTVEVSFDGPYSGWRDLLTAPVLPRHVYADENPDFGSLTMTGNPVGTGPFVLSEFSGRGGIEFTANASYRDGDLEYPRLDGIDVSYAGPSDAIGSLSSSRSDFGLFVAGDAPESGDLMRDPASRQRTELIVFNSSRLDAGRRAEITSNLNRAAISSKAGMELTGSVFSGVNEEDSPKWRDIAPKPERESLSGENLRVAYPAGGPVRDLAAKEVARQLEAAGAVVDVKRIPGGEFHASTFPSGDFDITLLDLGTASEYESLEPVLPQDTASAVYTSLGQTEDEERYLTRTAEIAASEYALAPLFVWPDSFAWSSTLAGTEQPAPPARAFASGIGEWGFYK